MNKLLNGSKLFVRKNASTILTCIGGAGVIATSVLAVRATPKALMLLENAKKEKGESLTKMKSSRQQDLHIFQQCLWACLLSLVYLVQMH